MKKMKSFILVVAAIVLVFGIVTVCIDGDLSFGRKVESAASAENNNEIIEEDAISQKYNIVTTEDWINHVSSASNVKGIDRGYSSMSPNQIANVSEELSLMVKNLKSGDVQAKAKCRALYYLFILPVAHMEGNTTSDFVFTASELNRIESIFKNSELSLMMMKMTLGDEEEQLYNSFLQYYASIKK